MSYTLLTEDNKIPEIDAGLVAELDREGDDIDRPAGDWYATIRVGYPTIRAFGNTREDAIAKAVQAWNESAINRMKAKQHKKKDYEQSFDIVFEDIATRSNEYGSPAFESKENKRSGNTEPDY